VNCPQQKIILGCPLSEIFSDLLKLLPKKIKPFQNSNYPLN
jgi:hypothetical protein